MSKLQGEVLTLPKMSGSVSAPKSLRGNVGAKTINIGGKGDEGATFVPSVSADGIISWTNDKDLPNPEPVNIKGVKGDKGDRGLQGVQGIQGERGEQGQKGDKGDRGEQGIQGAQGAKGDTGATGAQGEPGKDGVNGKDGTSAAHSWNGTTLTITSASGTSSANLKGEKGDRGEQGIQGDKGDKGDPGSDYVFTEADKNEILAEVRATANQQTPLFANSVDECTDTSKVYVLPDGYLYGYVLKEGTSPEITYESRSGGYWTLQNSKIKFITQTGINAKKTNVIPVTPGDQLSYQGQMKYGSNKSVLWYDASGALIASEQIKSNNAPKTVTAPANSVSVEFLSFNESSTEEATLIVEWILCQAAAPTYRWASTGHAFVTADYESRIFALESRIGAITCSLKGKKIIYDGDSICYGAGYKGGYAKIIAELTGSHYVNQAVGGARLVTKGNNSWHSVVDNLPNLPTDGDLYCFEGGINDYWTSGMNLGTVDYANFTGALDTTTVCGALESIFRYSLNTFVGKPICFVITHKIQSTAHAKNSSGNTFKEYHDAMVSICEKYSIPFYDAFNESGLNGWNTAQNNAYLTGNTNNEPDGCHPNEDGYNRYYVPQLIQLFERIMPI